MSVIRDNSAVKSLAMPARSLEKAYQMKTITVLLADDHTILRKGLKSLLEDEPRIQVIGEAADGHEAVELVPRLHPDVVIMDLTMPILNGFEATRLIKRDFPQVKVLVLSMHANEAYVVQLLRVGASGYLVKRSAPEELVTAIEAVYAGNAYLSPCVSTAVIEKYICQNGHATPDAYELLTDREREVFQLLAERKSNREIADLLFISLKTVETHRSHLLAKLDLATTAQLIKYAVIRGFVVADD